MVSTFNKRLWRLAQSLEQASIRRAACESAIDLPDYHWRRSADLVRQIRRAHFHGWHLAAQERELELASLLPCVEQPIVSLRQRLSQRDRRQPALTARTIYEDLCATDDEYGGIEFNIDERWLAVATSPITLEGVYLGPFEIRLSWARDWTYESSAYRVIALEPHPAECRESVTHPHVSDEVLCEGEGRYAIRQALAQVRLLDFFLLVTRVLNTYNSESPYVELALWRGATCSDCGTLVDEDDSYACEKCGTTVCSGCDRVCADCDRSYCYDCISSCTVCDASVCDGCFEICRTCRARVCENCRHEDQQCTKCHEEEIEKDESNEQAPVPSPAV